MALKDLTVVEIERLEEIKFYLLLNNLVSEHGRSIRVMEILEGVAYVYSCDIGIIKRISNSLINYKTSPYVPSKFELALMLGRAGYPVRQIRDLTRIHPNTYYKYAEDYKNHGQYEFHTRMTDEERNEIKKFLLGIEKLSKIFYAINRR